MSNIVINILPINETQIVELFDLDILKNNFQNSDKLIFSLINGEEVNDTKEIFKKLIELSNRNFTQASKSFNSGALRITILRNQISLPNGTHYSPHADSITFSNVSTNPNTLTDVILSISEFLKNKNLRPNDSFEFYLPKDDKLTFQAHYSAISSGIANLADTTSKIITDRFIKIEEKSQELEENKKKELQKEIKILKEKELEVENLKANLEARLSEINDRENTHVRRDLYKEITDKINRDLESFSIGASTKNMREYQTFFLLHLCLPYFI